MFQPEIEERTNAECHKEKGAGVENGELEVESLIKLNRLL
jgi:hypothetical protein